MDSTEPGRRSGTRDPRGASPDRILLPESVRVPACSYLSRELGEEFLNGEDAGILHCGDSQAERGPGTPAPDPLPLRSSPGCLGEGAQEGEVAASASDICDGGRVSRLLMERAPRQDPHPATPLPREGNMLICAP